MKLHRASLLASLLIFGTGCPDDSPTDSGLPDATSMDARADATTPDLGTPDGGEEDAETTDAGDTTDPTVTITAPADMSTVRGTITISADATDDVAVAGVELIVDGTPIATDMTAPYEAMVDTRTIADGPHSIAARAFDAAGNEAMDSVSVTVDNLGLPPDPATIAPPIDRTVPKNAIFETDFLFTNNPPVQTGLNPTDIDPVRRSVLRGRVLQRGGSALPGVVVSIHQHPEFGQTLTRADGWFDLVVNGGGTLIIDYEKMGFLSAHRDVDVPWNAFVQADDVILIALDSAVTTIDLTQPVQIARGTLVTDTSGTRRATVIFCEDSTAELAIPSGGSMTRTTIDVRATEYTAGDDGPALMPAKLPANSGYTYAVELSVDEALSLGSPSVTFDCAPSFYVENFLGFPVGEAVPNGYYDFEVGCWFAGDNGRVVEITAVNNGVAEVDTDGDGTADDMMTLMDQGFDMNELVSLATLYNAGQQVWRVELSRFSPHDLNWPMAPPRDAIFINTATISSIPRVDDGCKKGGSIIEVQNGILGESIPIAGTPFTLNYRNDRTLGWTVGADVVLTPPRIPMSLAAVDLRVSTAGGATNTSYTPAPNLEQHISWDRLDVYGRLTQGAQALGVTIYYSYPATYQGSGALGRAFAQYGQSALSVNAREEFVFTRRIQAAIDPSFDARAWRIGGWTIDVNHVYDTTSHTIYLGDGTRRAAENMNAAAVLVSGSGITKGDIGDGRPARDAPVFRPEGLAFDAEGNLYFTDSDPSQNRVRKIDRAGVITTIAGGNSCDPFGNPGCLDGEGGAAMLASLNRPTDVAIDKFGNIFIADSLNQRVRMIDAGGTITTVAGSGPGGYMDGAYDGDEVPAVNARLNQPGGIAVGRDCCLFIADTENHVIRKVDSAGIITTIAGIPGSRGYSGDGGPAIDAELGYPNGIAVDFDGTIYIADTENEVIRRIGNDGIITTVAGTGSSGDQDGPIDIATLDNPVKLAFDFDGNLLIADSRSQKVRRLSRAGIVDTVSRTEGFAIFGSKDPRDSPRGIAVSQRGAIYVSDPDNRRIIRLESPFPSFTATDIAIASEDGGQLYRFDQYGRHLETFHTLTAGLLYRFAYDADGLLQSITDADGRTTTIARTAGEATSITGPFGQQTALATNTDGYLTGVTNPANETHVMTYAGANGLLATFAKPDGSSSTLTYDADGRLIRDEHSSGRSLDISTVRSTTSPGFTTTVRTGDGRVTIYEASAKPGRLPEYTTIYPDGTESSRTTSVEGVDSSFLPREIYVQAQRSPDPRFGMQSSFVSDYYVSNAGQGNNVFNYRNVVLMDPGNLLSLSTLEEVTQSSFGDRRRIYDGLTKTLTSISREGRELAEMLDDAGRVIERRNPGLAAIDTRTFNALGQVTTYVRSNGVDTRTTQLTYDASGYLASVTDPEMRTFQYTRDAIGRLTRITLPDLRVIDFGYDGRGNMTSLTPPSTVAHNVSYREDDLVEEYTPPSLGAGAWETTYAYNLDGQLTNVTMPGMVTIEQAYNGAGQLESITFDRGTIGFTYDAEGRLESTTAPGGQTVQSTWLGQLKEQDVFSGGVAGTIDRTYNSRFLVESRSVNGNPVTYAYDNDDLIVVAGQLAITRDAATGFVDTTSLGNVSDGRVYNSFGELESYAASYLGAPIFSQLYPRDALGRVTSRGETIGGTTTTYNYTYDAAGRLATVVANGTLTHTYTYDANGNRTGDGTSTGTYDAQDRLISWAGSTYSYTERGTLAQRTGPMSAVTTYDYDALGGLRQVGLANGPEINYVIDGIGRRVRKLIDATPSRGFLYASRLRPIAEVDGANALVSYFVYGTREHVPDYMVRGGATYRLITDQLGSVRLVVDVATGAIAQRIDYGPFGEVEQDTSPGFQPFGFAGGLYDPDTGLVRFGRRDYDATTGRWTNKDPILFGGGDVNLYGYTQNDPQNWIDPTGEDDTKYDPLSILYRITERSNIGVRSYDPLDPNAGDEYVAKTEERARCDAAFLAGTEALNLAANAGSAPEEVAAGLATGAVVDEATSEKPGFFSRVGTGIANVFRTAKKYWFGD